MNNIFIISNGINDLEVDSMTTSSSKYELRFSNYLSKQAAVKILSSRLAPEERRQKNNVELIGIGLRSDQTKRNRAYRGFLKKKALYNAIKNNKGEKNIVVFWGYHLFTVLWMIYIKIVLKIPVISFIYDSHKPAISQHSVIKRSVLDLYFSTGMFFTRCLDGYIFFQEKAIDRINVKKKSVLVIKPGVEPKEPISRKPSNTFRVAFCGTLSGLNGIDALLDSLPLLEGRNLEINVCGYGPLLDQVKQAEKQHSFFHYLGVLNDKELYELYQSSDLLLNLRRLDDEAMDFAFPSKLFEYTSTSLPVVSTALLRDELFLENVYLLEAVEASKIAEQILSAHFNREEADKKGLELKKYVEDRYSFETIATDVYEFLEPICK